MLQACLRRDSARPLVTWYDDATGERIELSVATASNWANKTANLLYDDDIEAVRLDPPGHWLACVVALGAWTAGVAVDGDGDALPGNAAEFIPRVLAQPDVLLAPPATADVIALRADGRAWSLAELGAAARHAVTHHGVTPNARVLSTLSLDSVDGLDAGLLVPLAVDGSVVLVSNAEPAKLVRRSTDERVTHTAGVDIDGLPRLA